MQFRSNQGDAESATSDDWVYFMRHIAEWGWLHAIVRLREDSLVICNTVFEARLRKLRDDFACGFVRPDEVDKTNLGTYKNILVFLVHNECALVQKLRDAYPKALVASGAHEFSLVSKERLSRMKLVRKPPKPCADGPVVFLSTPNAGAEYFAESMELSGFIQPWEYIGRPFITMSRLYDGISFDTLIKNTEIRYKKDEGIAYLFQTDVLGAFFANTDLTQADFVKWLRDSGARVVTFRRRDPLMQACVTGLLRSTYTRSVWTMRKAPSFDFKYDAVDMLNIISALFHLQDGDAMIAELSAQHGSTKDIWLDEIADSPKDCFVDMLTHLGFEVPSPVEMLDYKNNFWHQSEMSKALSNVQYDLIDRLGLSVQIP